MRGEIEFAAVVGTPEGPARRVSAAVDAVLAELGYTAVEDRASQDLVRYPVAEGGWVALRAPIGITRAIGARLAGRAGRTVHWLGITARYTDPLECSLEDLRLRPDGRATPGPLARELESLYGDDWGSLCDGKAHFLLAGVIDAAIAEWAGLPEDAGTGFRLVPPASLGDPKLDALALQIRMAVRAERAVVEGRPCVRVTLADGAVVTTFLTADGLERIASATGPLLR